MHTAALFWVRNGARENEIAFDRAKVAALDPPVSICTAMNSETSILLRAKQ